MKKHIKNLKEEKEIIKKHIINNNFMRIIE